MFLVFYYERCYNSTYMYLAIMEFIIIYIITVLSLYVFITGIFNFTPSEKMYIYEIILLCVFFPITVMIFSWLFIFTALGKEPIGEEEINKNTE